MTAAKVHTYQLEIEHLSTTVHFREEPGQKIKNPQFKYLLAHF